MCIGSMFLLARFVSQSPFLPWTSIDTTQAERVNGSAGSILTLASWGLGSPKLIPINTSSWGGWYFDAVAKDVQSSTVVIPYIAPEASFVFTRTSTQSILETSLSLRRPDTLKLIS